MAHVTTRRNFLKKSSLLAGATGVTFLPGKIFAAPPSDQFRAVQVGVGGKGGSGLGALLGAANKVVAVADTDSRNLAKGAKRCGEGVKAYADYRKMIDEQKKEFDGIFVSTPDHTHAGPSLQAMNLGKHCYCEKPLAHNVWEVRQMVNAAKKNKVVTQMGTQIHAGDNYRRVVEIVQSGAIGPVKEFHVFCGKGWGRTGPRPTDPPPVPEWLNWDLWQGPAPEVAYNPAYCPGKWRCWWDYGSGTFGDMACHVTDLAFWALKLKHPTTCEATGSEVSPFNCPTWVKCDYTYAARGEGYPACTGTWSDGGEAKKHVAYLQKEKGMPVSSGLGVYFVGEKGNLYADYGRCILSPEDKFKEYKFTGTPIPKSIGHCKEWVEAAKAGKVEDSLCNFEYSGALSEAVLLGTVAYRVGKKLEWDAENLKAKGCPEADQFIKRTYRKGWELG